MSFGNPYYSRRRRGNVATGLVAALQSFLAGKQQGAAIRRQQELQDAELADRREARDFDRSRLIAGDLERQQANFANMVLNAKADDPTNPGAYNEMAGKLMTGQAQYGPQRRRPALFAAGARAFARPFQEPGADPISIPERVSLEQIQRGPSPYVLQREAAERTRQQKLLDDEAEYKRKLQLQQASDAAATERANVGHRVKLYDSGAPWDTAGAMLGNGRSFAAMVDGEEGAQALPDAGTALMSGLLRRLRGGPGGAISAADLGGVPQPASARPLFTPVGDANVSPAFRSQQARDLAAQLASEAAAEASRATAAFTDARRQTEEETRPYAVEGARAGVRQKNAAAARDEAYQAIEKARLTLQDRNATKDQQLRDTANGLRAMELDLQRQKFEWERTQQRLDPTTKERISGIDAEMQRVWATAHDHYTAKKPRYQEAASAFAEYQRLRSQRESLLDGGGNRTFTDPKVAVQSAIADWERLNGVKATQADRNRISQFIRGRMGAK